MMAIARSWARQHGQEAGAVGAVLLGIVLIAGAAGLL
jgi:hypothetical protein